MSRPHRQHARHAYRAAIEFRIGAEVFTGSTVNLSRGGLCADLDRPFPAGTAVDVDIQLVFEDERQSEALRLPGQIMWCTAVRDAYQVGLTFRRLDADCSVYLMMFLRYLDPGKVRERAARPATVDERFGWVD